MVLASIGGHGNRGRGKRRDRPKRAVHPDPVVSRRAVCGGRLRLLRRRHRLFHAGQPQRRHQRRKDRVGGMRDRVQRVARRRMLRAAEDAPRRRDHCRAVVDRHRLRPVRAGRTGQDSDDDLRLRPGDRRGRSRLPVGVSAGHDVLGPGCGDDRLPRAKGRRRSQAQGQEDRVHVSRLGLRQGADPGVRRVGRPRRLRVSPRSR